MINMPVIVNEFEISSPNMSAYRIYADDPSVITFCGDGWSTVSCPPSHSSYSNKLDGHSEQIIHPTMKFTGPNQIYIPSLTWWIATFDTASMTRVTILMKLIVKIPLPIVLVITILSNLQNPSMISLPPQKTLKPLLAPIKFSSSAKFFSFSTPENP